MKKSIYLFCFLFCTYSSIAQDSPIYISVEDMIANFHKNKKCNIGSYNLLDHSYDYFIVADSLFPQISGINPKYFRGQWTLLALKQRANQSYVSSKYLLYLTDIKIVENVKRYEKELVEKYGKDSIGIPAIWFSGKIYMSDYTSSQDLFGKIVSKYYKVITVERGVVIKEEHNSAKYGDMEGSKIFEINEFDTVFVFTIGNSWPNTAQYSLSELDTFVNRGFNRKKTVVSFESSILLVTNEDGEASCYLLEPEKLNGKEERKLIKNLITKIESLPLWSFGWLYTIDGSIFQGRYIKATYSSDQGWNFIDYVMILDDNQNISE